MIKLLQVFVSATLLAVVAVALDFYSKSGFLHHFMQQQSLSLMGTILAIYIAATTSYIAILTKYEDEQGTRIFTRTIKEIKQNIVFIFILFVVHFFLLIGTSKLCGGMLDILFKFFKTFVFMLFLYALYDISDELFTLKRKLPKKLKDYGGKPDAETMNPDGETMNTVEQNTRHL